MWLRRVPRGAPRKKVRATETVCNFAGKNSKKTSVGPARLSALKATRCLRVCDVAGFIGPVTIGSVQSKALMQRSRGHVVARQASPSLVAASLDVSSGSISALARKEASSAASSGSKHDQTHTSLGRATVRVQKTAVHRRRVGVGPTRDGIERPLTVWGRAAMAPEFLFQVAISCAGRSLVTC